MFKGCSNKLEYMEFSMYLLHSLGGGALEFDYLFFHVAIFFILIVFFSFFAWKNLHSNSCEQYLQKDTFLL